MRHFGDWDKLNCFSIIIPRTAKDDVTFTEHLSNCGEPKSYSKSKLSFYKWKLIVKSVESEFNKDLKKRKQNFGRFSIGTNYIERLLGKELMVLIWAIENASPEAIPAAISNWLGFSPEERWWLYTITNAATGGLGVNRGWRKALMYALTENPTSI